MIRAMLIAGLLVAPSILHSQVSGNRMPPIYRNVPRHLTSSIFGRLVDERTGEPVVNARIAARWPARQGREPTDTLGRFLLDLVEPGPVTVDVNCPSRTMLGPHVLDTLVQADTGRTYQLELRIEVTRCAEPDPATHPVSVRGVYSAGFEESRFVPCRDSTPEFARLWGPVHLRNAWVEFSPQLRGPAPRRWPSAPRDENRYPRWYVEWVGALTGPGTHGHLGVSPYLLVVDSVVAVKVALPDDCVLVDPFRIP